MLINGGIRTDVRRQRFTTTGQPARLPGFPVNETFKGFPLCGVLLYDI